MIYVELASQNGGMMRDLSEEGFAVRVMMPLRVGETTPFVFSLDESIRIDGEGTVLWVQEKGRVAGVKFTRVTSAARVQICGWLNGPGETECQNGSDQSAVAPDAPTLEQLRVELRASPPRPVTATPIEPAGPSAETLSATRDEAAGALGVTEPPLQEGEHPEDPETEEEPIAAVPDTSQTEANAPISEELPALTQMASEPTVEGPAEAAAGNESKPIDSEGVAEVSTGIVSRAPEVVVSVPQYHEQSPRKEKAEDRVPSEIADVAALFTPIEDHSPEERAPSSVWPADGQIPFRTPAGADGPKPETSEAQNAVESSRAAHETGINKRPGAEPQSPPSADVAPQLPRLALRLSAAETSGTKGPFSVGPRQPEPAAPVEERPKRFWSTAPAQGNDQPVTSAAERKQERPPAPSENLPHLPDIASILIQPSGAGHQAVRPESSMLEALRPWPQNPPTKKQNWVEGFTLSRAIGIMILLVVAVGLYVYRHRAGETLIWLGEEIGGGQKAQSSQAVPSQNKAPADSSTSAAVSETQQAAEPAGANEIRPTENRTNQNQKANSGSATANNAVPTSGGKPRNASPSANQTAGNSTLAPVVEPNTEAGQAEYQQAMQILQGKYPSYALAEAVKLLWAAVEKGNPNAELALADMYWHGKGTARNCDQTRILLTAASRKGSAEAQKRLQQFQQEGCE